MARMRRARVGTAQARSVRGAIGGAPRAKPRCYSPCHSDFDSTHLVGSMHLVGTNAFVRNDALQPSQTQRRLGDPGCLYLAPVEAGLHGFSLAEGDFGLDLHLYLLCCRQAFERTWRVLELRSSCGGGLEPFVFVAQQAMARRRDCKVAPQGDGHLEFGKGLYFRLQPPGRVAPPRGRTWVCHVVPGRCALGLARIEGGPATPAAFFLNAELRQPGARASPPAAIGLALPSLLAATTFFACKAWVAGPGLQGLGGRAWVAGPGLQGLGCRAWVARSGLQGVGCKAWVARPGPTASAVPRRWAPLLEVVLLNTISLSEPTSALRGLGQRRPGPDP